MGARHLVALRTVAVRQYGVVTRAQALTAGLSTSAVQRLLSSGLWIRAAPATYAIWPVEGPRRWMQRVMAGALWLGPGAGAPHRAAARLWDLDGFEAAPVELVTSKSRDPRHGFTLHRSPLPPRDVTVRHDVPVTSIERTLIDLGSVVDRTMVEPALESALRARVTTLAKLRRRLERCTTEPGSAFLRSLVRTHGGTPTGSPLETEFAQFARARALPDPVRQHPVRDARGRLLGRADFALPAAKIAIEVDSDTFHSSPIDTARDELRQGAMEQMGWEFLRLSRRDIRRRPTQTARRLERVIARRAPASAPENVRRAKVFGRTRWRDGRSGASG